MSPLSLFENNASLLSPFKEELTPYLETFNIVKCKKNQQFIVEGTSSNGLFFIVSGSAKIFQTGIFGKEQIIRLAKEGEMIGFRSLGENSIYSIGASAIDDIVLVNIPNQVLREILRKVPELTINLMNFFSDELNRFETKVRKQAQMTVREKVIDTLLYINRKFGINDEGLFNLQLLRREIADFAGTTEEQVIRVISSLKKEDLLKAKGKQLGIIDLEKLKKEISEHNFFLIS